MFKFGTASKFNLLGTVNGIKVRPELVALANAVLSVSPRDFMIVDGVRTLAEQKLNVKKGVSKTMRSRHLTGHAIDFAPVIKAGIPDWHDLAGFAVIGTIFNLKAKELGIAMDWGGEWKWKDWGHIQLTWKKYPK